MMFSRTATRLLAGIGGCSCILSVATAQTVVWHEDFDGPALDSTSWEVQLGDGSPESPGWGHNELQWYTDRPENLSLSGGTLKLTARNDFWEGHEYTSARIRTAGLHDILYGRVEARMKLAKGQGIRTSLCMLPTVSFYGEWPASGEIDIVDGVNDSQLVHGSIHFGGEDPLNALRTETFADGSDFSEDFHTYAVEWTPGAIRWFVDDVEYQSLTSDDWYTDQLASGIHAPFDQPFHIIISLSVGGSWPGIPDGATVFPAETEIDSLTVTTFDRLPYLGAPIELPGTLEAENFDEGPEGEVYQDCDPTNHGGAYRPNSSADIAPTAEDGFRLGWMCDGEWFDYSVDVEASAIYQVDARVSSPTSDGAFSLSAKGFQTGTIPVPNTAGDENWTTVSQSMRLVQGEQILQLAHAGGDFSIDRLRITRVHGIADWDLDGLTNAIDMLAYLALWFVDDPAADLDASDRIDSRDLLEFLACWFAQSAGAVCN